MDHEQQNVSKVQNEDRKEKEERIKENKHAGILHWVTVIDKLRLIQNHLSCKHFIEREVLNLCWWLSFGDRQQ